MYLGKIIIAISSFHAFLMMGKKIEQFIQIETLAQANHIYKVHSSQEKTICKSKIVINNMRFS